MDERVTVKFDQLPLVSVLKETAKVKEATELLQELDAIQVLVAIHRGREEELKIELGALQKLAGTEGLRWGSLCFTERLQPGRETLDKQKLMEVAGVTAAQMKECTKTGKPFEVRTFRNLGRKDADKES
jgi:hypothetical protein